MAASSRDKDFVHQIEKMARWGGTKLRARNFYQWEAMANDRAEALSLLEEEFLQPASFVVLQLGENVVDAVTFSEDLVELIALLKARLSPEVILVLGNFWQNDALDMEKQKACEKTGARYISLKDLQSPAYQVGLHAVVQGMKGEQHEVLHDGVARHPNDQAMKIIAERVCRVLESVLG